ncbi:uncharacterized protein LOC118443505 isoform X2 [Vespa mandarinia]|uniref:uncharacterized protein LOC118443505 isoform X2 n=1 Tax=Vespa mandarinia TaxID=7446 RepID=UPI00161362FA|nr:uncharacterized protein LOC118443505 isoform X2 [Vespa mandarinia]
MSQGCPSVSHQLAAASIAFRRARKKFPKDYGVRSKDNKTEIEWIKKNKNDQPVSSSSAKCMSNNDKSQCFCSPSVYSDDDPRYLSAKQSLSIKQSKCTCCRHNKEYFEESTRWSNDQSAVGDVLDKVSTREQFIDVESRKSVDRYNHDLERDTKNNFTHLTRRKCTCCPMSIKKRIENDPSKLDSIDLLYVASHEKHCCVNSIDNRDETLDHFSRRNRDDQELRRSCSKLDKSTTRKEEISPLLRTCDPRSPRDINLDLLRSPEDHRPRLCHRCPACPRHSCRQRCHFCQQKSERISNFLPVGCTCLSILGNRRGCSSKDHERIRTYGKKEEEEEEDENVGVIDHKDSISILMEKYKSRDAQEERQKRKNRSKGNERTGNCYEESQTSRILARENRKDSTEGLENSKSCDRCRCQENRLRWKEQEEREQEEKTLLFDDGRNRIRGEGDFYRRKKPARSKFGVPWRHTF